MIRLLPNALSLARPVGAPFIRTAAAKVVESLLSVADTSDFILNISPFQVSLDQSGVVSVIFRQKDRQLVHQASRSLLAAGQGTRTLPVANG